MICGLFVTIQSHRKVLNLQFLWVIPSKVLWVSTCGGFFSFTCTDIFKILDVSNLAKTVLEKADKK